MAHYFKYFPTTEYDIDKSNSNLLLTDVTKRFTIKDTLTKKFWDPIFKDTDFKEFVKTYYSIGHRPLIDIDLDIPMEGE